MITVDSFVVMDLFDIHYALANQMLPKSRKAV
jgi:hypothetical protein